MRIKFVAVLVALITAGAAFALSPVARAENVFLSNTDDYVAPQIVDSSVNGSDVELEFVWQPQRLSPDHPGGYNLFIDRGDGYGEFITSLPATQTNFTHTPGEGTFEYSLTRYIHLGDDTIHTVKSDPSAVTVGSADPGEEPEDPGSDAAGEEPPAGLQGVQSPAIDGLKDNADGTITITWDTTLPGDGQANPAGYAFNDGGYFVVRVDADGNVHETFLDLEDDRAGNFTSPELPAGEYTYLIEAYYNGVVAGEPWSTTLPANGSETINLAEPAAIPDAPVISITSLNDNGNFTVSWPHNEAAPGYQLFKDGVNIAGRIPAAANSRAEANNGIQDIALSRGHLTAEGNDITVKVYAEIEKDGTTTTVWSPSSNVINLTADGVDTTVVNRPSAPGPIAYIETTRDGEPAVTLQWTYEAPNGWEAFVDGTLDKTFEPGDHLKDGQKVGWGGKPAPGALVEIRNFRYNSAGERIYSAFTEVVINEADTTLDTPATPNQPSLSITPGNEEDPIRVTASWASDSDVDFYGIFLNGQVLGIVDRNNQTFDGSLVNYGTDGVLVATGEDADNPIVVNLADGQRHNYEIRAFKVASAGGDALLRSDFSEAGWIQAIEDDSGFMTFTTSGAEHNSADPVAVPAP